MIEVTLKFENQQTADSFVTWFQTYGFGRFFYMTSGVNTLDLEGRTFFLTNQEETVLEELVKEHGRNTVKELETFDDVPNGLKEPLIESSAQTVSGKSLVEKVPETALTSRPKVAETKVKVKGAKK